MTRLTAKELPEVVPLLRALHDFHVEHIPGIFHADASAGALLAFLETRDTSGAWFFGHRQDDVLGAYLMAIPETHPRDNFRHHRKRVLLDHVFVDPALRGQGIAQALVREMEAEMQREGIPEWVVRHHAFNTRAGEFFAKLDALPSVIQMSRIIGPR